MTGPVHQRDAYRRGVDRARMDRTAAPAPDGTVTVSVDRGPYADRAEFKLCRHCGWARPGRCTCDPQAEASR